MSELQQGFNNDLSKTFDTDDLSEKVAHSCKPFRVVTGYFAVGSVCQKCGEIVKK